MPNPIFYGLGIGLESQLQKPPEGGTTCRSKTAGAKGT